MTATTIFFWSLGIMVAMLLLQMLENRYKGEFHFWRLLNSWMHIFFEHLKGALRWLWLKIKMVLRAIPLAIFWCVSRVYHKLHGRYSKNLNRFGAHNAQKIEALPISAFLTAVVDYRREVKIDQKVVNKILQS